MVVRWLALGAAMLALGCGPDVDRTELAPLCGQVGPMQILELGDNEVIDASTRGLVPYGGGFLVAVREFDGPVRDVFADAQLPTDLRTLEQTGARTVWIDGCGGEPVPIADGIDEIMGPSPGDGLWLGCRQDTGDLFSFDPDGADSATLLAPRGCYAVHTAGFVVASSISSDEPVGDLVRIDLQTPGAPEIQVLATGVANWQGGDEHGHVAPGKVLALTLAREVWEIDVADGIRTLVKEDVSSFFAVREGRFLIASHEGDVSTPGTAGRASLTDRLSGTITELGVPDMQISSTITWPDTVNVSEDSPDPDFPTRTQLTFLPSMESVVLDGHWFGIGVAPDGKHLLKRYDAEPGYYTLEPGRIEPQRISDRVAVVEDVRHDAIVFSAAIPETVPDTRFDSHLLEYQETVFRIPFSTFEPETLVDNVFQPLPVDDGRWVNIVGFAADQHGDLEVVDPQTNARELIDTDVYKYFARYNGGGPARDVLSNGDIVYAVRDGDRTGLWRVRLAD